jgi:hypothetical protein
MPYADPEKRRQFHRDYQRAYYHKIKDSLKIKRDTEEHRARDRERMAAYRAEHPEKVRARNAVNNAIRDGRMIRRPCEICGGKSEAHHDDYNRPLDVRWLCRKHHDTAHGRTIFVDPTINGDMIDGD